MSYLTHIEDVEGRHLEPATPHSAPPAQRLRARYDMQRLRREIDRSAIEQGPASLWRYAPLLPVDAPLNAVSLSEGWTPLLDAPSLSAKLGIRRLLIKDEGRNPSGTFKDRGASVAVSRYRELGVSTVAHNSSGNAGGSWSLYAARAGITCVNILPTDAQPASRQHCRASGQPVFLLDNWHIGGRLVEEACNREGWLNICTLREPYRLEGKKTMGLEIAEQLGWRMPDAIVYPMGGGLGALAIYKAFEELLALGWISGRLPRLYITQYEGCAPLVRAWEEGASECLPWGAIEIPPGGLKSPNPPGGAVVLELLRHHGGGAVTVSAEEAFQAVDEMTAAEGVFPCPESATTLAGLRKAQARGWIGANDEVVLICTGSGLKSIPSLPASHFTIITSSAELHA